MQNVAEPAAEWVALDELTPWADNPRRNESAVPHVMASIRRFGFAAPIVARRANREVIAGHTRLEAARRLGLDRVPVRFVDLDPADAHLLAIADNKLGEIAEWDDTLLAQALDGIGDATEGLGFSDGELMGILTPPPDFSPGSIDDQAQLDEVAPKMATCPDCGHTWDQNDG